MGIATWLKQTRLTRLEGKIKSLRTRQKLVRRKEEDTAQQRRAGTLSVQDAKAREEKLHLEKEKLTHDLNDLLKQEEELRAELEREGALPAR